MRGIDDAGGPEEDAEVGKALTAEDLRDLAIARKVQEAASRQLPGLIDALISEHHDALLDVLELKINVQRRSHLSRPFRWDATDEKLL